jgi:hypothetical protein
MPRWQRVPSASFFRGKAAWYREMAEHVLDTDRDGMLTTARAFDARAQAREQSDAAAVAATGGPVRRILTGAR